jgi:hypothetical protein
MKTIKNIAIIAIISFIIIGFIVSVNASAGDPVYLDDLNVSRNQTKAATSQRLVNISGGYISTVTIWSYAQDPRWKGMVGSVVGKFVLADQSGSKLFDWTLPTLTGRVYATRNSSSPLWSNVNCSNLTFLNEENVLISHTSPDDNLNMTFNYAVNATHNGFNVGARTIAANTCPTLNTYVNSNPQDNQFEEMALYDGTNTFYSTIINSNQTGFDGSKYDFQMIVPENGGQTFTGSTAYYLYVELGN